MKKTILLKYLRTKANRLYKKLIINNFKSNAIKMTVG